MGWGTRLGGDRPDTRRHFLATTSAASCLPTIFLPRTNFYPDNTTTGTLHHYFLPPLTICIVRLPEKMMRRQECIEFLLSAEGRFRKMCSMLQKVLASAGNPIRPLCAVCYFSSPASYTTPPPLPLLLHQSESFSHQDFCNFTQDIKSGHLP